MHTTIRRLPRLTPLAACLASICALVVPAAAIAETITVNDCSDGAGDATNRTLRYALTSGATDADIDLSACTGSTISLSGSLYTSRNNVTLNGPGAANLTLDASASSFGDHRTFKHYGTGTLTMTGLSISGGYAEYIFQNVYGGCIYSKGTVSLVDTDVSDCYSRAAGGYPAKGGGIYAAGGVTLSGSHVHDTTLIADSSIAKGGGIYAKGNITLEAGSSVYASTVTSGGIAYGGGIFSGGNVTLNASQVHDATSSAGGAAVGGGVYAAGTVALSGSDVQHSTLTAVGNVGGGGVLAVGLITLDSGSSVSNNSATSSGGYGVGGGIFAGSGVTLTSGFVVSNTIASTASVSSASVHGGGIALQGGDATITSSVVASNSAQSAAQYTTALGGGVFVNNHNLTLTSSTVTGNSASGNNGQGGGIFQGSGGSLTVKNSTIDNNLADDGAGLLSGGTTRVVESTISDNTASVQWGAITQSAGSLTAYNMTVSRNEAPVNPGLTGIFSASITLQSTILANNSNGSTEEDFAFDGTSVPGANNLIVATSVDHIKLPGDTIFDTCPLLGPLRDNGGPTFTRALLSGSPAIDTGNNVLTPNPDQYDQRGSPFLRLDSVTGLPDIGAYEVQQNDVVFNAAFDGCA